MFQIGRTYRVASEGRPISTTAILIAVSIDWTAACVCGGGCTDGGGHCGDREEEEGLELHLGRRFIEYESGFV